MPSIVSYSIVACLTRLVTYENGTEECHKKLERVNPNLSFPTVSHIELYYPLIEPGEWNDLSCIYEGLGQAKMKFYAKLPDSDIFGSLTEYTGYGLRSPYVITTTVAKLHLASDSHHEMKCEVSVIRGSFDVIAEYHGNHPVKVSKQKVNWFKMGPGKERPRIEYYDTFYKEIVGFHALLPCQITGGSKEREILWFDNNNLPISKRHITHDGDLEIKDLKMTDKGVYRCVAKNQYGEDQIETVVEPVTIEEYERSTAEL